MYQFFRLLCALLLVSIASPALAAADDRPVPAIKHAIIISADGLRPDLLLRANAPRLHQLLTMSSYTMWARTTPAAITLPSHVSMLTGVPPEWHGITWNADLPLKKPVYPNSPTLFALAKRAGLTTAAIAGKSKFTIFDEPGVLNWKSFPTEDSIEDAEVLDHALTILREHRPDVMFVHFATVDNVGHAHGWGSPQQMAAIEKLDGAIGKLLDALSEMALRDSTLLILTADHGGAGRTHGPEDPRSRTIPWIVSGPGIRRDFDLTRLGGDFNIDTYDTFATACTMLGIPAPVKRRIVGKFIPQILDQQELTLPGKPPSMAPATAPAEGT